MTQETEINFRKQFHKYVQLSRINRPVGYLLLLWPTFWGLWMAEDGFPDLGRLIIFTLGVFAMRSAGCIINDIVDRDYDKNVTRTSSRVLVTGEVSLTEAYLLLLGLLALSLSLLVSLNELAVSIAVIAGIFVAVYPFFLNASSHYHRQSLEFLLVLVFLWPLQIRKGVIDPIAWTLFVANFFWAISYDTSYAMMDKEDDLKVG